MPPKLAASENVTKSLAIALCPASVTVTILEPFVAEKVTSPALVVVLIGVMSLKV